MVQLNESVLKLQIMWRAETTLHIIHSAIEVEVIIFQAKRLFCIAFKMNQTRMCEMERPFIMFIYTILEKNFLSPLSFSSTISFFLFTTQHTFPVNWKGTLCVAVS